MPFTVSTSLPKMFHWGFDSAALDIGMNPFKQHIYYMLRAVVWTIVIIYQNSELKYDAKGTLTKLQYVTSWEWECVKVTAERCFTDGTLIAGKEWIFKITKSVKYETIDSPCHN